MRTQHLDFLEEVCREEAGGLTLRRVGLQNLHRTKGSVNPKPPPGSSPKESYEAAFVVPSQAIGETADQSPTHVSPHILCKLPIILRSRFCVLSDNDSSTL